MRKILFAPTPDPAKLRKQDTFTIEIHENGQITGDLCRNTTDLLEALKEYGIESTPVIDFCG
jgi:hypothetical protein